MLRGCLESLFGTTCKALLEVYVVDNASADGTSEMLRSDYPHVHVLRNEKRLGFTSNNNLVLAQATGRYAMLLNDDVLVLDGAIDRMVAYMAAHPEVAAVGGQLLNPDGSLQDCFFTFPHPVLEALHPLTDRWRVRKPASERPFEIDWACGASLMVRREILQDVGLLDPAFNPIYSEETDWCYRIRKSGRRIVALPDARFIHYGGQTMNRVPARRVELLYQKRTLFFDKHHGRGAKWTFKMTLWLTSLLKLVAWSLLWPIRRERASAEIPLHWHMVRRALLL